MRSKKKEKKLFYSIPCVLLVESNKGEKNLEKSWERIPRLLASLRMNSLWWVGNFNVPDTVSRPPMGPYL